MHDSYHSFVMRARFLKYNGSAANHVMLSTATLGRVETDSRTTGSPLARVSAEALAQLDRWLTNIANDKSDRSEGAEARGQQAGRFRGRLLSGHGGSADRSDGKGHRHGALQDSSSRTPAIRASRPALRRPTMFSNARSSRSTLRTTRPAPTAEQLAKLRQIFPDGVCDYTKPGVGEERLAGTWAFFKGDGEFVALEPRHCHSRWSMSCCTRV